MLIQKLIEIELKTVRITGMVPSFGDETMQSWGPDVVEQRQKRIIEQV